MYFSLANSSRLGRKLLRCHVEKFCQKQDQHGVKLVFGEVNNFFLLGESLAVGSDSAKQEVIWEKFTAVVGMRHSSNKVEDFYVWKKWPYYWCFWSNWCFASSLVLLCVSVTALLRKLKQQSRETVEDKRPKLLKALKEVSRPLSDCASPDLLMPFLIRSFYIHFQPFFKKNFPSLQSFNKIVIIQHLSNRSKCFPKCYISIL